MSDQSRRSRPLGAAAAPKAASPAIAVVIALLAAVLGFFILKKLDGNDSASGKTPTVEAGTDNTTADGEPQDSIADGGVVSLPSVVVEPVIPVPLPGTYTVVVANGSGKAGAAKSMTTLLQIQAGMTMGAATNVTDSANPLAVTKVYFTPGNDAQGKAIAKVLGCTFTAEAMPATPPVDPANIVDAQVLIVQGLDLATAPALSPCPDAGAPAAAPVAPAVDPAAAAPVISTP
jgi:hypothetical protein